MSEDKIPYTARQFITIKEACLLTGKSSVTIRRLIKRVEWENASAISQAIKQEITPTGFVYKIAQDFLLKELKLTNQTLDQVTTQNEKLTTQATTQEEGLTTQMTMQTNEIRKITQEKGDNVTTHTPIQTPMQITTQETTQIIMMKDFIKTLTDQLNTKDLQIQQFMKAQERSDILLKGLQDKIFLIEQRQYKNGGD
jgi:hypothetical protein